MSAEAAVSAWAESLEPVSVAMLEAAALARGERVLDLGAGSGQFAVRLAGCVGPTGTVVAVDPSPDAVAAIARQASEPGAASIRAVLGSAESLALDGEFDAVVARNSVMYFSDLDRALTRVRRLLRRGGRFVASVYAALEHEPFHAIPLAAVRRRATLSPPLPEYAAAFEVSADDVAEVLAGCGFEQVRRIEVPVRRTYPSLASLESSLRASRSLGELFGRLPEAAVPATWAETLDALGRHVAADGTIVVPGRQVVVTASA
ncbi:MAG: class I SAM-dependent methyltransferase [Steroidobacteraceae bacterium]